LLKELLDQKKWKCHTHSQNFGCATHDCTRHLWFHKDSTNVLCCKFNKLWLANHRFQIRSTTWYMNSLI